MGTQKDPASNVWLTRRELAAHLNLSVRKIDYMTAEGELPFTAFGRSKRFHRATVDEICLKRQVRRGNGKD